MIIDLQRFLAEERPYWEELERLLDRVETDLAYDLDVSGVRRFRYLYQRTSADLVKLAALASEHEVRRYLEGLVARAYGEIHEVRESPHRFAPVHWFLHTFPRTFRRHLWAFGLSVAVTLIGILFGAFAMALDPNAKETLMPFPELQGNPSDRVAEEEARDEDRLAGVRSQFSAFLMTHNTRIAILTMALGMTWGLGTTIILFSNGVMMGAVAFDYIHTGETAFLLGWLLPHGSFEIPAILLAGQAGILLASALIGWGARISMRARLRRISPDIVTLVFGCALMLVWAGIVEAFFSQYHEPIVPYWLKIGFGVCELSVLWLFLAKSGAKAERPE